MKILVIEDEKLLADSLRTLMANGYVYQTKEKINSDMVKVLRVNWQKAREDRLL